MAEKFDDFDLKILRSLQMDAARSMDSLADIVGLSRNACWRRVRQLEESGVVKQRVAVLDAAQLDLGLMVFVHLRAKEHTAGWLEQFRNTVSLMPEIRSAFRMSGELDYLLQVQVANVAGYDRFYQRLIARIPASDISASFVMEEIKNTTALPI